MKSSSVLAVHVDFPRPDVRAEGALIYTLGYLANEISSYTTLVLRWFYPVLFAKLDALHKPYEIARAVAHSLQSL